MNVIQEITVQTSQGTNDAADSIGQLAKMAVELQDSVAGFKLPSDLTDDAAEDDVSDEAYEELMVLAEEEAVVRPTVS